MLANRVRMGAIIPIEESGGEDYIFDFGGTNKYEVWGNHYLYSENSVGVELNNLYKPFFIRLTVYPETDFQGGIIRISKQGGNRLGNTGTNNFRNVGSHGVYEVLDPLSRDWDYAKFGIQVPSETAVVRAMMEVYSRSLDGPLIGVVHLNQN